MLPALLVEADGLRDQRHHLGQAARQKQPAARQLRHAQTRPCTQIGREMLPWKGEGGEGDATVPGAVLVGVVEQLQHSQQHCSTGTWIWTWTEVGEYMYS